MTARARSALSFHAFAAGCQAGAFLLSLATANAQTPLPAPRSGAKPTVTTKAQKSAPSKPGAKPQAPPPPPAAATSPAPKAAPPVAPTTVDSAPKLPPLPPIDTSKPPPMLPRASREKMRACAEEWDDLKRRTRVGELTWRVFATKCLTR